MRVPQFVLVVSGAVACEVVEDVMVVVPVDRVRVLPRRLRAVIAFDTEGTN